MQTYHGHHAVYGHISHFLMGDQISSSCFYLHFITVEIIHDLPCLTLSKKLMICESVDGSSQLKMLTYTKGNFLKLKI